MKLTGFGKSVFEFNLGLKTPSMKRLPYEFINPFEDEMIVRIQHEFCSRFYKGKGKRIGIFGINPGRLGAGITGIPFTDPKNLKAACGIHSLPFDSSELSSEFVYSVINEFGGLTSFYQKFYIGSVCPLGLLFNGTNANYYDSPELIQRLKGWIADCMITQVEMGLRTDAAIVLGTGKNAKFFAALNNEFAFFERLHVLDHPRYIMQYKRRDVTRYINDYKGLLSWL